MMDWLRVGRGKEVVGICVPERPLEQMISNIEYTKRRLTKTAGSLHPGEEAFHK